MECVGSPDGGLVLWYTLNHHHWANCIYQDRWIDDGSVRQRGGLNEYWSTCSSPPVEIADSGYVPAFAPNYGSSTTEGEHVYYDQPMRMGYHYDSYYQRWYETWWIGYFEVDSYVYSFDTSGFVCPA